MRIEAGFPKLVLAGDSKGGLELYRVNLVMNENQPDSFRLEMFVLSKNAQESENIAKKAMKEQRPRMSAIVVDVSRVPTTRRM
jgi:hypothetical protein